eukprot:2306088-Prymnesium_polylepis.1
MVSSSLPLPVSSSRFVRHTFCTSETFGNVAKAVEECAFVTSELPLILSLEVTPQSPNPRNSRLACLRTPRRKSHLPHLGLCVNVADALYTCTAASARNTH